MSQTIKLKGGENMDEELKQALLKTLDSFNKALESYIETMNKASKLCDTLDEAVKKGMLT